MSVVTEPLALASQLAAQLAGWLPGQRWFGAKDRRIAKVSPVAATLLTISGGPEPARLDHVLLEVSYTDGSPRHHYQVLVGYRRSLPERLRHVRIGELADVDDWRVAYDGLWDDQLSGVLPRLMAFREQRGLLRFRVEDGVALGTDLPSRVIDAEQSNSSVVYGDAAILKLFRRIVPGDNPDLEAARALRRVACQHVPGLLGEITGRLGDEPVSYAMLSEYAVNSADGWSMATASVRDLMAEQDLRADEVGGDFAAEAYRLGEAVAAVHTDLARAMGTGTLDPTGMTDLADRMRARLASAITIVPELEPYEDALRAAFHALATAATPVPVQRIHGDLHLGQVLRTPTTWLLIDFEGEPITPLSERVRQDSPLRDVAAMSRSFDYAAMHLLATERMDAQLRFRAHEWSERNRDAFCSGYASAAGFDPRQETALLRAYELDKAVYEAVYETRNRPRWLPLPLDSIARGAT